MKVLVYSLHRVTPIFYIFAVSIPIISCVIHYEMREHLQIRTKEKFTDSTQVDSARSAHLTQAESRVSGKQPRKHTHAAPRQEKLQLDLPENQLDIIQVAGYRKRVCVKQQKHNVNHSVQLELFKRPTDFRSPVGDHQNK